MEKETVRAGDKPSIAAELAVSARKHYVGILLQLPVSFLFGAVIDLWNALLPDAEDIAARVGFLCGSLFFTALGILLVVTARLVPDPPPARCRPSRAP